jgi:hypothetical protein
MIGRCGIGQVVPTQLSADILKRQAAHDHQPGCGAITLGEWTGEEVIVIDRGSVLTGFLMC